MKRLSYIFLAGSLGFIALNLLLRFSGVAVWDDAYFFFRYADNLLEGGQYSWNLGEDPTFGLTSPLYAAWVLLWQSLLPLSPAAVLWWSSCSAGLLAAWALFKMVNQVHELHGEERAMAWWGIGHSIALTAPQFAVHLTSGMDTTLAIAAVAFFLLQWLKWTQTDDKKNLLWLAVLGGLMPFVRPELMVFSFGVPLLLLWQQRKDIAQRNTALIHLGISSAVFGLTWFTCHLVFGSWIPLSFFVKSFSSPYGLMFAASYRGMAFIQLGIFLLCHLFLLAIILIGWIQGRRSGTKIYKSSDGILFFLMVILTGYFTLKALPIMGYHQRFLMPLIPVLYLLGARFIGFRVVSSNVSSNSVQKARSTRLYLLVFVIAIAATWRNRPSNLRTTWGQFSMENVYHELGRNNWPYLDDVARLSPEISVASTELGILGIQLQNNRVVDLSGLLDPKLARGFDANHILNVQRPDLIYLPHPDYTKMRKSLFEHPDFERYYIVFSEQELQSWMGMAIRRDSPWAKELLITVQNGQSSSKN